MTAQIQPAVECGNIERVFVHFDELDALRMLHNARYAVILERSLGAFWEGRGYTNRAGAPTHPDTYVAVAEYSISYKMPDFGTGEVLVNFWVDKVGTSSVVYAFRFTSIDGATVHAEGRRVHIRIDPKTMRPTAWGEDTLAVYQTLTTS